MPTTLSQRVGAPSHPSPLALSTLLVIDAQTEYVDGSLPLSGIDDAIAEIARLLDLARHHGVPVIHIHHHGPRGGGLFDPAGPFAAPIPALVPIEGETIIVKALPNSFAGTDLADVLRASGRPEVIIAGFATHMCVSATARAALDHGLRATIVAAACATRDLPDPAGGVIAAETLHRVELAALADRFAVVVANASAWAG
jgi:nicotinamidase-related amidase